MSIDSKTKDGKVDRDAKNEYTFQRITNAHFFNLGKFLTAEYKSKAVVDGLKEFTEHMTAMRIGTETPVLCYDSTDGGFASLGAALLSSHGVKSVVVFDGDFKSDFPKSDRALPDPKMP